MAIGVTKKLLKRILVLLAVALAALLLPIGVFKTNGAEAEVEKTEAAFYQADEYGYPSKTVSKSKTEKVGNGEIKFTTVYPKFEAVEGEEGNEALIKKLNRVIYYEFYKEGFNAIKGVYDSYSVIFGDAAVMEANAYFGSITRKGNILSIPMNIDFSYPEYNVSFTFVVVINYNLHTGRELHYFTNIFKNTKKLKNAVIKEIKAQIAADKTTGKYNEEINWETVKDTVAITTMAFTPSCAIAYISEGLIAPLGSGTFAFEISYDLIDKYLKEDRKQLLNPLSSAVISLPENPSTGYAWKVDSITGKGKVELTGKDYVSSAKDVMLVGAGGTRLFCFRAVAPGKCQINLSLYSPSGQKTDTAVCQAKVGKNLMLEISEPEVTSDDSTAGTEVEETELLSFNADENGNMKDYEQNSKTVTYDSGSISVESVYPVFIPIEGDSDECANAVMKACRKAFYTEVIEDAKKYYEAKGYKAGDNAKLNVSSIISDYNRKGNLFSLSSYIEISQEDGTVETGYYKTVSINLHTRKRVASLKSIFNDVDSLKNDIIASFKNQLEWYRTSFDIKITEDIDWKAIKNRLSMSSVLFNYGGALFNTLPGEVVPAEDGIIQFIISDDILMNYVKPERVQLLAPYSSALYEFGVDFGAGYEWVYEYPEEEDTVMFVNALFVCNLDPEEIETVGEYTEYMFFKAVAPGEETLKFNLVDSEGNVVQNKSIKVQVLDDLFLLEVNGEA